MKSVTSAINRARFRINVAVLALSVPFLSMPIAIRSTSGSVTCRRGNLGGTDYAEAIARSIANRWPIDAFVKHAKVRDDRIAGDKLERILGTHAARRAPNHDAERAADLHALPVVQHDDCGAVARMRVTRFHIENRRFRRSLVRRDIGRIAERFRRDAVV